MENSYSTSLTRCSLTPNSDYYDSWRTVALSPLRLTRNCPLGSYRLKLTVTYTDPNTDQPVTLTAFVEFQVVASIPPTDTPVLTTTLTEQPSQNSGNGQNAGNPGGSQNPPQPQGPVAITQPENTNVRLGPGTGYDVVTILPQGTWARITGIDAQAEWVQIEVVGMDAPVWVARNLTKVAAGSPAAIPQIVPGE